jgi:hypothetical protein
MTTPASQIEVVQSTTTGASNQTDLRPHASDAITLEVKSTYSEEVQDLLDDLKYIYGQPSERLGQVLTLLSSAIAASKEAIEFEKKGENIRADEKMLYVQALLGDLFAQRSIGDGFSVVVGALTFAFVNKEGMPFDGPQLFAVLRTLNSIRTAPFCSTEAAIPITEVLEDAGLCVDPAPLSDLLEDAQEAGIVES